MNYGANGANQGEGTENGISEDGNSIVSSTSDDDSLPDGGERSFRQSKALPNVLGQLNASNVFLSTRALTSALQGIDRTESGHYENDSHELYQTIPSLMQERVALVCDANLHVRDKGRLYYDESSFYNDGAMPYFVITVNPYIYKNIMHEVWHATSVPCGMYFCCQGGDGAHTGEAHEDFVSIQFAWFLVGVAFLAMIIVSAMPGDEEWGLNG